MKTPQPIHLKSPRVPLYIATVVWLLISMPAQAKTIWVGELDGFGLFLSQAFTLTDDGSSVNGAGNLEFLNLSYQGDALNIRALQNNDWTVYLPFALGVYRGNHMPISGDESFLAFVPNTDFPSIRDQVVSVPIPVPEPSLALTAALALIAAIILALVRARN